jgi:hypothetical protein
MVDKKIKISDEDILESIKPDIDAAKAVQDDLAPQREEYYKRYRGESYGNERTGWSTSVAPVIYNNLQWSLPSLMEIFHEEYFTLKSDNEDRAFNFQKLIYYQMYRKQDGYRRAYEFLYNANIYHYAVFKVFHKEDFDIEYEVYESLTAEQLVSLVQDGGVAITKYTEVEGLDGVTYYENVKLSRKKITFSAPYLEVVPNWEFYYSPDCKIGDWGSLEGRLVFHEVTRTMNDIRKKERAGVYRKGSYEKVKANFEEANKPSAKVDSYEILIGADDVSDHDTQAPETNELNKQVKIRECYYSLDIDGDGLLEPVIVTMCGETILQVEENPYKRPPFRLGSLSPEPHKVTGLAMPKILDNDQKVQTNLLRLIQDSAAQSCYRNPVTNDQQMFKMLQDRKPFAVILGDPNKLGEIKTSDPSQFILKAYEMEKQANEEKTGNTRYNQGTDAASLNKTATGINAIFTASEKRMRLTASLIGNGVFLGVIRDFIYINQKWPSQDPIKLLGQNIEINKEDLSGEYDIDIDIGTSPSEKQSNANQLDLMVQFGTKSGIQMGVMDPIHIMRAVKKKYRVLGIKIDDLMKDEKTYLAEVEKKKQEPPKEDWREFVQIDKLFPLLTPMEQFQILNKLEIKPDPRRERLPVDALPGAGTTGKEEQIKLIADQRKHEQNLRQSDEKHKQQMQQNVKSAVVNNLLKIATAGKEKDGANGRTATQ